MKKNKQNFILKATLLSAIINNQLNAHHAYGMIHNTNGTVYLFGTEQTTNESIALLAIILKDTTIKIIEPELAIEEQSIEESDNTIQSFQNGEEMISNSDNTQQMNRYVTSPTKQVEEIEEASPTSTVAGVLTLTQENVNALTSKVKKENKTPSEQSIYNGSNNRDEHQSDDDSLTEKETTSRSPVLINSATMSIPTIIHTSNIVNQPQITHARTLSTASNISNTSLANTISRHKRTLSLQSPAQTALQRGRRLSIRGTNAANVQTGKEFSSDEIDKIKETFSIMLGYNESLEIIQNEDPISQQISPRRKKNPQAKVIGKENPSNEYTPQNRNKPTSVNQFIKELNDQANQIEKWLLELEKASNFDDVKNLIEELAAYYAILRYQITSFDSDANHLEAIANLAFYIETINDKNLIEKVAYIIMPSIEQLSILQQKIAETIQLNSLSTKEKEYLELREIIVTELADYPILEQQALAILLIDRFTGNHELFENLISSLNIIKNNQQGYASIQATFSAKVKSKIEQLSYNTAAKALKQLLEAKAQPSKPESKEQIENLSKNLKDALNKHIKKITPAPSLFNSKPKPDKTSLTPEVLGQVMYEASNTAENQGKWLKQDWIEYAKNITIQKNQFTLPDLSAMRNINRLSIRKAVIKLWQMQTNNRTVADKLNKTTANLFIEQFQEIGYAMQQAAGLTQETWKEYAYNVYIQDKSQTTDYDKFIEMLLDETNLAIHIAKQEKNAVTPSLEIIKHSAISDLSNKLKELNDNSAQTLAEASKITTNRNISSE